MASSSSLVPSSLAPVMKKGKCINWAELPSELTSSILQRLSVIEILENAQKVCKSWYSVSKDPAMWRKIVMHDLRDCMGFDLQIMCRHAVDRSQGGLVQIDIQYFGTDSLLHYISHSSSNLRSLKLANCSSVTDYGFGRAVVKFPLLEDLEVSYCSFSRHSLKFVGKACPNLNTLKLNRVGNSYPGNKSDDGEALAIAETMHGLRHLQLFGNKLSNTGLSAILDNCPNLEHLDLRQCFNVKLVGDLEKRCSERIKVVRHPNDSTHDYPYDSTVFDTDSDEEDYLNCYDFDNYDYGCDLYWYDI